MKLISVVVFVLLLSGSCFASDLSFFAGWMGVGSLQTTPRLDLDNTSALGIRYEKGFAFVGVENSLTYYSNALVADGRNGNAGLSYTGDLVINVPIVRPQPFFVIGLGFLHKVGHSLPDIGTSFVTDFGGGLKLPNVAGPAGFRIEYRRLTIYDVLDKTVGTNELSGGLMLTF